MVLSQPVLVGQIVSLMLLQAPHASLTDIAELINSKGVARVELKDEDIQTLLNTLIADGRWVAA